MKAAVLKKLIPASALALSLVAFASCRIEKIIPELEPYLKEVTVSESKSRASALAGSGGSNTKQFKADIRTGYQTNSAESAPASVKSGVSTTSDFIEGYRTGYTDGYSEGAKSNTGNMANSTSPTPTKTENSRPLETVKTAEPVSVVAVTASQSPPSKVPSWGYTLNDSSSVSDSEPSPSFKRPTASSKSPTRSSAQSTSKTYASSRSRGGCAGGS